MSEAQRELQVESLLCSGAGSILLLACQQASKPPSRLLGGPARPPVERQCPRLKCHAMPSRLSSSHLLFQILSFNLCAPHLYSHLFRVLCISSSASALVVLRDYLRLRCHRLTASLKLLRDLRRSLLTRPGASHIRSVQQGITRCRGLLHLGRFSLLAAAYDCLDPVCVRSYTFVAH